MAFEDQLKIVAEAVGFTEATKAVDALAMARQKLAEADARASTARTTGTVGDLGLAMQEQARAADAVRLLGGETGNAGQNAQDAALGFSQLVEVLRVADPRLGRMVGQVSGLAMRIGDLATKSIDLGTILSTVTGFVRTHAGALALLGATGGVVAGIAAVTAALAREREELKRVNDESDRRRKANDAFLNENDARRAAIENIADRRREGGPSPDQARQMEALSRAIGERFPQLKEKGDINEAVGLLFGTGATSQDIEEAAFLLGIDDKLKLSPDQSPATRLGRLRRSQRRRATNLPGFFGRESIQDEEDAAAFLTDLQSGGSEAAIRKGIQRFGGADITEEMQDRLVSFFGKFRSLQALQVQNAWSIWGDLEEFQELEAEARPILNLAGRFERRRQARNEAERARRTRELQDEDDRRRAADMSPPLGDEIIPLPVTPLGNSPDQERENTRRRLEQIERERANRGASVIEINHYNSRFVGPGAAAQAAAIRNGRTFERDAGERIV